MKNNKPAWIIRLCCCLMMTTFAFASEPLHFEKGIAVTPAHFPGHSPADLDKAYRQAGKLGKYTVFIAQWHKLNLDVVRAIMQKSRQNGLTPILGLSPTSLDQGRKELDLPAQLRRQADGNVSFANPVIRKAFIQAAVDLARLKPQYLCLATEINFLALFQKQHR